MSDMNETKQKSFFKSKAFYLILAWIVLGVVLHIVVVSLVPDMKAVCQKWAQEQNIDLSHAHGDHGACYVVGHTKGAEHQRLAAAMAPLTGKMTLATAWTIPNFLILFTLLFYFMNKSLGSYLQNRRDELERSIREAREAREAAEAKLAEYEQKINQVDKDIEELKEQMRREGEAEKQKLIEQANSQAERISREADFTAKQEVRMAQYRLQEEAARLAVEVAEKVIREVINEEDRERILNEYLEKVREQAS
ncbi:MAG: ATP synthase F0 subunit B [bacterium]